MSRMVCVCGKLLDGQFMCDECFAKEEKRRKGLPTRKGKS
jgi:hypothetical protein